MSNNLIEIVNQLVSNFSDRDNKVNDLIDRIETILVDINSIAESYKFDVANKKILSCEFLFVRCRTIVEFEQVKIKQILQQPNIESLKPIVKKRELYLSQVSMSLDKIQSDIANLQRLVYNNNLK